VAVCKKGWGAKRGRGTGGWDLRGVLANDFVLI